MQEAHRSARRLGISADAVDSVLAAITLITLSETTILLARSVGTDDLRTLDALHLAAALELESDLEAVVTYAIRLARACHSVGVTVRSPGQITDWFVPAQ